jgi:hypothetical protein
MQTGQGGEWVIVPNISPYTQHSSSSSSEGGGVRAFNLQAGCGPALIRATTFLRLGALTGIWAIFRGYSVWNRKVKECRG